jgi:deoxyribodipyrimidine photo-lyase
MSHASQPIALVWHRTDLRLADNTAVTAAAGSADGRVVGISVLPEDPLAAARMGTGRHATPLDFPRASLRRTGFLLQAIEELRDEWRARGSALEVAQGDAGQRIAACAVELGVREVHTAPCLAYDERQENAAVARALAPHGITLVVHDETTMIAASDLPFAIDELPDVFSSFRRSVEKGCHARLPIPEPDLSALPEAVRAAVGARSDDALAAPAFRAARAAAEESDPRVQFRCNGGRSHGLSRIRRWMWGTDSVARYKETRDGLVGADFSSRLSPWLALGTVSPREVAAEVRRYERERMSNESTYWLLFELLWRDYFHFWVRRWQGRAFKATGVLGRTPCGTRDHEAFAQWREGRTGEPFVDAGMRELAATGQLSNRARQNVASWLARTAGVDWRLGAAWFESQLIDFDVGSNWGNWQYVAGVGNDPRNRTFDVRAQAERYDQDGSYRELWSA